MRRISNISLGGLMPGRYVPFGVIMLELSEIESL